MMKLVDLAHRVAWVGLPPVQLPFQRGELHFVLRVAPFGVLFSHRRLTTTLSDRGREVVRKSFCQPMIKRLATANNGLERLPPFP
jgi:hypothetical protein